MCIACCAEYTAAQVVDRIEVYAFGVYEAIVFGLFEVLEEIIQQVKAQVLIMEHCRLGREDELLLVIFIASVVYAERFETRLGTVYHDRIA